MLFLLALFALFNPADAKILRPHPRDFSQISDFHPDWCTANVQGMNTAAVCYGKSLFRKTASIRSILVKSGNGQTRLYLEDQWPSVDLLKPAFGLVGPVLSSGESLPESGSAVLSFDQNGEVRALMMETPTLGTLKALR